MANRITDLYREILKQGGTPAARSTEIYRAILQQGGAPAARTTEVYREVLQQGGNPSARTTEVYREVLMSISGLPTAGIGLTQAPIEVVENPGSNNSLNLTSAPVEVVESPDDNSIELSQAPVEVVQNPVNAIWWTTSTIEYTALPNNSIDLSQAVIEVVGPNLRRRLRVNVAVTPGKTGISVGGGGGRSVAFGI